MTSSSPGLAVVPLAEHVEAGRKADRSEIVKVARHVLEMAERGELIGLACGYQYAREHETHGGGVGSLRAVAPGANAATLMGALEMAKIDLWDRYLREG